MKRVNKGLLTFATLASLTTVGFVIPASAAPAGDGVPAQIRALTEAVAELRDDLAAANKRIAELERHDDLTAKRLRCVSSLTSGNDFIFEGCNVHVRNGAGQTDTTNKYGNLIVGYNKNEVSTRTGSHNIVIGDLHEYTSWGGIVSGTENFLSAPSATVLSSVISEVRTIGGAAIFGADRGIADVPGMIAGGKQSYLGPDGNFGAVIGGQEGATNGRYGVTLGGHFNIAAGSNAVVMGGSENQAIGTGAAICGGEQNIANAGSISGGAHNTTNGRASSVSGGYSNTANGDYSSILGGNGVTVNVNYGTSP